MRFYTFLLFLLLSATIPLHAQHPYAADLERFKLSESLTPPPKEPIVFIGSSSFTLWKDVNDYFPGKPLLNRAYGGSRLTDLIRDYHVTLVPYHPKQVIIYCGENDFAAEDTLSPGDVLDRFTRLFTGIRTELPGTKITFVSMKPSPSRWHLKDKYIEANRLIRKFIRKQKNASFINVWNKMLDDQKEPDKSLFLEDQLHMNKAGYGIWRKAIHPHLIK